MPDVAQFGDFELIRTLLHRKRFDYVDETRDDMANLPRLIRTNHKFPPQETGRWTGSVSLLN